MRRTFNDVPSFVQTSSFALNRDTKQIMWDSRSKRAKSNAVKPSRRSDFKSIYLHKNSETSTNTSFRKNIIINNNK